MDNLNLFKISCSMDNASFLRSMLCNAQSKVSTLKVEMDKYRNHLSNLVNARTVRRLLETRNAVVRRSSLRAIILRNAKVDALRTWQSKEISHVLKEHCPNGHCAYGSVAVTDVCLHGDMNDEFTSNLIVNMRRAVEEEVEAYYNKHFAEQSCRLLVKEILLNLITSRCIDTNTPVCVDNSVGDDRATADVKELIKVLLNVLTDEEDEYAHTHYLQWLESLIAVFIRKCTCSDLIWLIMHFLVAPSTCVGWGQQCIRFALDVALEVALEPTELPDQVYLIVMSVLELIYQTIGCQDEVNIQVDESWAFIQPSEVGAVANEKLAKSSQCFLAYLDSVDVDTIYTGILQNLTRSGASPLSTWSTVSKCFLVLLIIYGKTLSDFVRKNCLLISMQVAAAIRGIVLKMEKLYKSVESLLPPDVQQAETEKYIMLCLVAWQFICAVEKLPVWQVLHTMPMLFDSSLNDWRLLNVVFRCDSCPPVVDLMLLQIDNLHFDVESYVEQRMNNLSDNHCVHFCTTIVKLCCRLVDRSAIHPLISSLLSFFISSKSSFTKTSVVSLLKELVNDRPALINELILLVDYRQELNSKEFYNILFHLPVDLVVIDDELHPVISKWLEQSDTYNLALWIVLSLGQKCSLDSATSLPPDLLLLALTRCADLIASPQSTYMETVKRSVNNFIYGKEESSVSNFYWALLSLLPADLIREQIALAASHEWISYAVAKDSTRLALAGTIELIADSIDLGTFINSESLRLCFANSFSPLYGIAVGFDWWSFCIAVEEKITCSLLTTKRENCIRALNSIFVAICPYGSQVFSCADAALLIFNRLICCVAKNNADLSIFRKWFFEADLSEETLFNRFVKNITTKRTLTAKSMRLRYPWLNKAYNSVALKVKEPSSDKDSVGRKVTKMGSSNVVFVDDAKQILGHLLPIPRDFNDSSTPIFNTIFDEQLILEVIKIFVQLKNWTKKQVLTEEHFSLVFDGLVKCLKEGDLWTSASEQVQVTFKCSSKECNESFVKFKQVEKSVVNEEVEKDHERRWNALKHACDQCSSDHLKNTAYCIANLTKAANEIQIRCHRSTCKSSATSDVWDSLQNLISEVVSVEDELLERKTFFNAHRLLKSTLSQFLRFRYPQLVGMAICHLLRVNSNCSHCLDIIPTEAMDADQYVLTYETVCSFFVALSNLHNISHCIFETLSPSRVECDLRPQDVRQLCLTIYRCIKCFTERSGSWLSLRQVLMYQWVELISRDQNAYVESALTLLMTEFDQLYPLLIECFIEHLCVDSERSLLSFKKASRCLEICLSHNLSDSLFPIICPLFYAVLKLSSVSKLAGLTKSVDFVMAFFCNDWNVNAFESKCWIRCAETFVKSVALLSNISIDVSSSVANIIMAKIAVYGVHKLFEANTEQRLAAYRQLFLFGVKWNAVLPDDEAFNEIHSLFQQANVDQRNFICSLVVQFNWTNMSTWFRSATPYLLLLNCASDARYHEGCTGVLTSTLRFLHWDHASLPSADMFQLFAKLIDTYDYEVLLVEKSSPVSTAFEILKKIACSNDVCEVGQSCAANCIEKQQSFLKAILRLLTRHEFNANALCANENFANAWNWIFDHSFDPIQRYEDSALKTSCARALSEELANFVLASQSFPKLDQTSVQKLFQAIQRADCHLSFLEALLTSGSNTKIAVELVEATVRNYFKTPNSNSSWDSIAAAMLISRDQTISFSHHCLKHSCYYALYGFYVRLQWEQLLTIDEVSKTFVSVLQKCALDESICALYLLIYVEQLILCKSLNSQNVHVLIGQMRLVGKSSLESGMLQWFCKSKYLARFTLLCRIVEIAFVRLSMLPSKPYEKHVDRTLDELKVDPAFQHFTSVFSCAEHSLEQLTEDELLLFVKNVIFSLFEEPCVTDRCNVSFD